MAGKLWVKFLAGRDIAKLRARLDTAAIIALAVLVAAGLASCKGRDQPRSTSPEGTVATPLPLTAEVLAPVMRERAVPGELPDLVWESASTLSSRPAEPLD